MSGKTLHLTNPLTKGPEVKKAQELLKAHGYFKGADDGIFGAATGNACKKAKYHLGYLGKDIKPSYGHPLNGLLAGTIKMPIAYQIRAKARNQVHKRRHSREQQLRAEIVANARWLIHNHNSCTYQQLRPIDGENRRHKVPLRIDCSGYSTIDYVWAGAPDPNGEHKNGLGYTGTLWNYMHHVTIEEIQLADLVIFGAYPGEHVCIVIELNGLNPLLGSMGHQGDPGEYPYLNMKAGFPGQPVTWLTLKEWL